MTKQKFDSKKLLLALFTVVFFLAFSQVKTDAAISNIALNKSYSSSVSASDSYPDTDLCELVDGQYATESYADTKWQGRQNVAEYTQTIDFSEDVYLTDVSCRFLKDEGCGIYLPATVTFLCSDNGTDFITMGNGIKSNVTSKIATYTFTLPNAIRTRYIKISVATGGEWTFTDEFEATGIYDKPLNIAQTKRYTCTPEADSSYADINLKELTNGKYASNVYTDTEWQGHLGNFNVVLDLGTNMRVTSMDMNFLKYDGGAVNFPTEVSFECSDNNQTFQTLGVAVPKAEVNSTKKYELILPEPTNTRYIKVNISASSWAFADELRVFGHPIISGSFIQLSYGDIWTQSDWEREFDYMKDLGMDHVILQWIIDRTPGEMTTYYNSSIYNPSTGYANRTNEDALLNILNAAEIKGIDVWVGLAGNSDWWTVSKKTNVTWLTNEAQANIDVIQDIWDSANGYKDKSSFKGWYIVWEIENHDFMQRSNQQKLRTALKSIIDYAHSYTNKPIMTSPYIGGYDAPNDALDPNGWKDMWSYMLDPVNGANFDVVAPQDSFGTLVNTYMPAMREAVNVNPNCDLWSNCETYVPGYGNAEPTITMLNQVNTEIPFVSKMTSFSFLHYHSPSVVGYTEMEDWKRVIYPRLGKTYTGPAMGYENKAAGKSYTSSVPTSTQKEAYIDKDGIELTNKKYGGSVNFNEEHYQARKNVASYEFIIDLNNGTQFHTVMLNFIKQQDENVYFPQSVAYYSSTDGLNYTQLGVISSPATSLAASASHYQLELNSPVTARYVKAVVTTGTTQWTACDEMEVIGLK